MDSDLPARPARDNACYPDGARSGADDGHSFRGEIDEKKVASIYRSLLSAGFPADLILRELKSMTREGLPEASREDDSRL